MIKKEQNIVLGQDFGSYNTFEDIDRIIGCLEKIEERRTNKIKE